MTMAEPGRVSAAVVITIDRMPLHYIQSIVRGKYSSHLQAGTWETGELRNWPEVYPQLGKIIAYQSINRGDPILSSTSSPNLSQSRRR